MSQLLFYFIFSRLPSYLAWLSVQVDARCQTITAIGMLGVVKACPCSLWAPHLLAVVSHVWRRVGSLAP